MGHALTWETWTGLKCAPSQFTAPWRNWWRGRAMAYSAGEFLNLSYCLERDRIRWGGPAILDLVVQVRTRASVRKGSFISGLSKDFPSDSVTITVENLSENDIAGAYFGPRQQYPYYWLFKQYGACTFPSAASSIETGVHGQAPPLAELLNSSASSSFHPKSLWFHLFYQYYTRL